MSSKDAPLPSSTLPSAETPHLEGAALLARFREVRAFTLSLVEPLEAEDMCVQTMPDVSPTKWHLAHTAWFFERFVLKAFADGYQEHHPRYDFLFNSYYQAVGPMHARPRRGHLSRPTVREVRAYRAHVDDAMTALLERGLPKSAERVVELGLHHEQQHQELLLTDVKHVLGQNPLYPAYTREVTSGGERGAGAPPLSFVRHEGGLQGVGATGGGFTFDNEEPRHKTYLAPFALASRPVTCGEYRAFLDDGGYARPELWLSDGWETVQREGWRAPLYWLEDGAGWQVFTLHGLRPLRDDEPVCHVSFLEADAYARWAGARLPSEAELEVMSQGTPGREGFVDDGRLHPAPAVEPDERGLSQLFGGVWEWTQSAYAPYPGYRPAAGALGEYNGKFMLNQLVLRGGSCFTSLSHIRRTYRNFFHAPDRWQMTGLRLARDDS